MERMIKETFAVMGMEGSTEDGVDFIPNLWDRANTRYGEISHLVLRDADGVPTMLWGAMSDFSRAFRPWEADFSRGLYLAGAECPLSVQPPQGWTKWIIPGFEYLRVPAAPDAFRQTLRLMAEQGLSLAGAVQDCTDPRTGTSYMLFPIRRL